MKKVSYDNGSINTNVILLVVVMSKFYEIFYS